MNVHRHEDSEALAERTTRLIGYLDGALSSETLQAMQNIWSTLERASADNVAHARAVRERLLWNSLAPGRAASPAPAADEYVTNLVATWDDTSQEGIAADETFQDHTEAA